MISSYTTAIGTCHKEQEKLALVWMQGKGDFLLLLVGMLTDPAFLETFGYSSKTKSRDVGMVALAVRCANLGLTTV